MEVGTHTLSDSKLANCGVPQGTILGQSCKTSREKLEKNYVAQGKNYARIGLKSNSSKTEHMPCRSVEALVRICEDSDPMLHAQVESVSLNSIMNYLGLLFDDRMMLAANPGTLEKKHDKDSPISQKYIPFCGGCTRAPCTHSCSADLSTVLLCGER